MSDSIPKRSAAAARSMHQIAPELHDSPVHAAFTLVEPQLQRVEDEIHRLLASQVAVISRIGGHLAFAGGKRFRPMLTLLAARASGFEDPVAFTVAAVGELLHTATLLHDDVVDGGEFRRGRPAARMAFGNGRAVLTGDYCYARAIQAIAHTGHDRANRSMSDAVTLMAEGEVAQLDVAGRWELDRKHYYFVIERKTAALISWCASVGHMVDPDHAAALAGYGLEVGLAFQISDDVIDYVAERERSGKARGQDLREGKVTLPLIIACEHNRGLATEVQSLLEGGPLVDDEIATSLVRKIATTEAIDRARQCALAHGRNAIGHLSPLPEGPAKQALESLALYVAGRGT